MRCPLWDLWIFHSLTLSFLEKKKKKILHDQTWLWSSLHTALPLSDGVFIWNLDNFEALGQKAFENVWGWGQVLESAYSTICSMRGGKGQEKGAITWWLMSAILQRINSSLLTEFCVQIQRSISSGITKCTLSIDKIIFHQQHTESNDQVLRFYDLLHIQGKERQLFKLSCTWSWKKLIINAPTDLH